MFIPNSFASASNTVLVFEAVRKKIMKIKFTRTLIISIDQIKRQTLNEQFKASKQIIINYQNGE